MIAYIDILGAVPGTGKFKDHKPTLNFFKELIMTKYLEKNNDNFVYSKDGMVDISIEIKIKSLSEYSRPKPNVIIDLVLNALENVAFENVKQVRTLYFIFKNVENKKEQGLKIIIRDKIGSGLGV